MIQIAIFAVISVGLVAFSWNSLRSGRQHAFPRLFVFEALLALVLLNAATWFKDPFSPRQLVSWLLLAVSIGLALHGFYLLRRIGRPSGDLENTTTLVRQGIYRYIRHPLYSSLLWLAWGAFLKDVSALALLLALAASAALVATARVEEAENLAKFGEGYRGYMRTTRMFVPFLF